MLEALGIVYGAASVVCLAVYAWDKARARENRRRVSERTLLLLGIIGGWPGAIVAQRWLRHKTRKPAFKRAFWITVVLNVLSTIALLAVAAR